MRRVLDWLYRATGWLAGLFLLAIFFLMMVMSIGRQIDMNVPAGDDLVAWCMAATAFLGLAHTFKSGEMIRVELIFDRLAGRSRWVLEVVSLTVGLVSVGYFAWYAVQLTYDSWRFNDLAQGVLPVPLWIPQMGYAFGLVVFAIAFADELARVLSGLAPTYEKPAPKTAEEVVERAIQSGV
ncbi:TRAP transporter small permease [Arenibaculum pallidiluteum]|uniref:TRAP transporter small permease n=1 Tax=Arenibaculum pallidiluteum TaxID=2812559 RepID=UPI001A979360|nr:TRAP transporter small permease [Arenibaculum pallidiluteum]